MPKTTTWKLPAHSAAKHELLRRYLEVWYAKLAWAGARRPGSQLNFIDAFAGPGIFEGGEPGSPIIALNALLNHRSFASWADVRFHFYFVETDVERARLEAERWQSYRYPIFRRMTFFAATFPPVIPNGRPVVVIVARRLVDLDQRNAARSAGAFDKPASTLLLHTSEGQMGGER